ncbi:helix-turn-helix domain-containing protein [Streptomyces sp. NPDC012510]|uniref:helix-turn-helix domain-containing protein n=1 Tax=Streptomyces sp. NPDC012510 TaxID=3364838 RepID=UPI0036E7B817
MPPHEGGTLDAGSPGTQPEDLGTATGLGLSRIDQVERGAEDMSLDDLLLIAHVLDVELAELVAD